MTVDTNIKKSLKVPVEFHFQGIFSGEEIDIVVDDEVMAQVVAKTQIQTGLALIETIELKNKQDVLFVIKDLNLKATVKVESSKPFVTINLTDGKLYIKNMEVSPGYL